MHSVRSVRTNSLESGYVLYTYFGSGVHTQLDSWRTLNCITGKVTFYPFCQEIMNPCCLQDTNYYILITMCQGKVGGKIVFLQVRELLGSFEKMSGNFGHLANVREFCHNNNFFFLKMKSLLVLTYFFKSLFFL